MRSQAEQGASEEFNLAELLWGNPEIPRVPNLGPTSIDLTTALTSTAEVNEPSEEATAPYHGLSDDWDDHDQKAEEDDLSLDFEIEVIQDDQEIEEGDDDSIPASFGELVVG